MKHFKVGKEITSILSNNQELKKLVDDKIFPLVANAGTTFPFIVYRRNGYRPASNKDYEGEQVNMELAILSDNYIESVDIADKVGSTLQGKETDVIEEIIIENSSEEFNSDTYIQKINLLIKLN